MKKEIRTSGSTLMLIIAAACVYPVYISVKEIMSEGFSAGSLIPVFAMLVVVIYLLILSRRKVVIDDDYITFKGISGTRRIAVSDTKGFMIHSSGRNRTIRVIPDKPGTDMIEIDDYLGNFDDIVKCLGEVIPDLDKIKQKKGMDKILSNPEYGLTGKDRSERLEQAGKAVRVVNTLAVVAAVLQIVISFYGLLDENTKYSIILSQNGPFSGYIRLCLILCMVMPLAGLLVFRKYNGLVLLSGDKNSPQPNLFYTMFAPPFALVLSARMYQIKLVVTDYGRFWMPAGMIVLVFLVTAFAGTGIFSRIRESSAQAVVGIVLLSAGMFAYGTVISLDFVFGRSIVAQYESGIADKWTSSRNRDGDTYHIYYISVKGLEQYTGNGVIEVPEPEYKKARKGDRYMIYMYKGMFNIPYCQYGGKKL